MLHRLRTGVPWRDLPERFGDPRKVRLRQRTWLADGVGAEITEVLGEGGMGTPVLIRGAAPDLFIRSAHGVDRVGISWPYGVRGRPGTLCVGPPSIEWVWRAGCARGSVGAVISKPGARR
ncbi:transposase [Streptomyces griseorubiginosus]|uniref:transposase n=1 Tax=Streptomyces griseorubiginosus TaxID=67304 RepID=UPI003668884D